MQLWNKCKWIPQTLIGSAVFAFGFTAFLMPHDMNAGGISGLAQIIVELLGVGSVGTFSILINLPLFILGGLKIGKKFFAGSLLGMLFSSLLIDWFATMELFDVEPLVGALYGGVLCGLGLGYVFICGTSTGGSDILVRLLKLRYRSVPIGQISMIFDMVVVALTGLVFGDISKALYTGIAVFVAGQVVDAVVYRFDYSEVAIIISQQPEAIAKRIMDELERGVTFLDGHGGYLYQDKKVILSAVKKHQLADLKQLVVDIDPDAFVIVQEAHQVLGDGFSHYSKDSL